MTVAGLGLLVAVMMVVTVALVLRAVRLRNSVSPKVATAAPLGWLWSPRLGPRLHRHLGRTVTLVGPA